MAYTQFDYSKPDGSDSGPTVVNDIRTNLQAVRDGILIGAMADWAMTTSGGTAEQPATIEYSRGVERLKKALTWGTSGGEDGNVTQVVYSYSSDSGSTYDTIGTLSITYDANGNVTSTSWT